MASLSVVGIVSIPGMFAGSVLSGADSFAAAAYQFAVLACIAATQCAAALLVVQLLAADCFDDAHALQLRNVHKASSTAAAV